MLHLLFQKHADAIKEQRDEYAKKSGSLPECVHGYDFLFYLTDLRE